MKRPLFRPQVLLARRERGLGVVVPASPPGLRRMTMLLVLVAAALAVLLVRGSWQASEPVLGRVVRVDGLPGARFELPAALAARVSIGDAWALSSVVPPGRVATSRVAGIVRGHGGGQVRVDVLVLPFAPGGMNAMDWTPGSLVRAQVPGARQPLYRWLHPRSEPAGTP